MNDTHQHDARQLDDGLANVLFDVWLLSRAATAAIDVAIADAGLDADEFAIYSMLASGDGMTPTDLAHWMAAPMTTVSSYVKRFERRGHVDRLPHPADGRSFLIRLTTEGRAVHQAAGAKFLPLLDGVNGRLGDDVDEMHRRLARLHAAVIAPAPPAAHDD